MSCGFNNDESLVAVFGTRYVTLRFFAQLLELKTLGVVELKF